MSPSSRPWLPRALLGLCAAVYLLAFPYHPALRSPNELCRLWQTRALVEFGTLSINPVLRQYGWVGDLSVKDGRFYPSKAPLLSFAAVPVLWGLQAVSPSGKVPEVPLVFFSRLLLTVLPALAMLVWLRRFLLTYLPEPVTDGLLATYALGSLALNYSLMFIGHQTTAVLLFAAFYALWRTARGEWSRAGHAAGGFFAAAAVVCEYTSAMAAAALALYLALASWRGETPSARVRRTASAGGLFALGAAPMLLALMAYHQACFGHPLDSGYKYLADAAYQPWHQGGFLGIRFPSPEAFAHSFFSPLRGLFALSPFLLLAPWGMQALWREDRAQLGLVAVLSVGYAYFTSSFAHDSWGWASAPRHLTGWIPFLLLPTGFALARLQQSRRWVFAAGVGLCATSVLVTGTVVMVNYVPDSLSTSLFGAAVPLMREGYFPATLFTFLGVPQPFAGVAVWALVPAAAALIAVLLLRPGEGRTWGAALGVVVLHLGLLSVATRNDAADEGARRHLRGSWWVKPGESAPLWP